MVVLTDSHPTRQLVGQQSRRVPTPSPVSYLLTRSLSLPLSYCLHSGTTITFLAPQVFSMLLLLAAFFVVPFASLHSFTPLVLSSLSFSLSPFQAPPISLFHSPFLSIIVYLRKRGNSWRQMIRRPRPSVCLCIETWDAL